VLGLDWALAPEGTISTAAPTPTTLQDFLKALPGELKIVANFPRVPHPNVVLFGVRACPERSRNFTK
jgi:hypothetical protein